MTARFSILPGRAVDDPIITNSQFRTLAALCKFTDREGWAWPSLKTIGTILGKSAQAVSKDIAALEAAGYVTKTARYKEDGGRTSDLKQVRFDYPPQPDVDTPSTPEVEAPSTPEVEVTSHRTTQRKQAAPWGAGIGPWLEEEKKSLDANQGVDVSFLDEHLRPMAKMFIMLTGLRPFTHNKSLWRATVRNWYEAHLTTALIEEATVQALADKLTVSGPQSVTNIALSIQAEQTRKPAQQRRSITKDRLKKENSNE